jgi:hypothetical protein
LERNKLESWLSIKLEIFRRDFGDYVEKSKRIQREEIIPIRKEVKPLIPQPKEEDKKEDRKEKEACGENLKDNLEKIATSVDVKREDNLIRQIMGIIVERIEKDGEGYKYVKTTEVSEQKEKMMTRFRLNKRTLDHLIKISEDNSRENIEVVKWENVVEKSEKRRELQRKINKKRGKEEVQRRIKEVMKKSEWYESDEVRDEAYDEIKWEQVLTWDKLFNFGIKKKAKERWRKLWSTKSI